MTPTRRYQNVSASTASKERLLILLLHSAMARMEQARISLQNGDRAAAFVSLDKALSIVQNMQDTLDTNQAAIAGPLAQVYSFVVWRLLGARARGDASLISEAIRAFSPIVEAFDTAVRGLDARP